MADNEATILSNYTHAFTANLNLAPMQTMSKLIGAVDADLGFSVPGDMFNVDYVAETDPEAVQTRVPDTPDKFIGVSRRVGYFSTFQDSAWFDNVDKANVVQDPSSTMMQSMMAGMARYRDAKIMAAMLGNAYSKPDDTDGTITTIALPAAQTIAVNLQTRVHQDETIPAASADYGLSIGKLIETNVILDESELEGERYLLLSSLQIGDLLARTPATSKYYNEVSALAEGRISHILGLNIIKMASKRLLKTGSNRRCIAWIKGAVEYKARSITEASVSIRNDKSNTPQAFYKAQHGASRNIDTAVVEILCKEG